jgi:hypothetical protein
MPIAWFFFLKSTSVYAEDVLRNRDANQETLTKNDRLARLFNHATAQSLFSYPFGSKRWPQIAPWAMLLIPVHRRVLKGEDGSTRKPESEKGNMKKFLSMGALALALAGVCSAPAPAWLNWKLGLGLNFGWQSGGNNTLWGFFRNGQPPGPDCGGAGGCPLPPGGPLGGGYGFQPNSIDNRAPDATRSATPQSYQSTQWNNYNASNTVGYRYNYNPYYNYGYGAYGYNYYPR